MPDKQPFHRDLDVEVWMSEPDFRIGIDEEQISSLESMHEDLYFVTLDFFDALGRTTVKRRLAAPGKIFPIIHPDREGQAGNVRVLYAGNASAEPKLELAYKEKGVEKPVRATRKIAKIDATTPQVLRAVVASDTVKELELQIDAKDDKEAGRAADAWDALATLHAAGLYRTALSYDHVGRLALAIATKDARTRRLVPYTGTQEPSPVHRATGKSPQPLITWDHIISPEESEAMTAKLAALPRDHSYQAPAGRIAAAIRRCWKSRCRTAASSCRWPRRRRTSRPSSSPAGSTPTKCRRPVTSCGSRSCWSPIRRITRF